MTGRCCFFLSISLVMGNVLFFSGIKVSSEKIVVNMRKYRCHPKAYEVTCSSSRSEYVLFLVPPRDSYLVNADGQRWFPVFGVLVDHCASISRCLLICSLDDSHAVKTETFLLWCLMLLESCQGSRCNVQGTHSLIYLNEHWLFFHFLLRNKIRYYSKKKDQISKYVDVYISLYLHLWRMF